MYFLFLYFCDNTHDCYDYILSLTGNCTIAFQEFLMRMSQKLKDSDAEDDMLEAFKVFNKSRDVFFRYAYTYIHLYVLSALGSILPSLPYPYPYPYPYQYPIVIGIKCDC